MATIDELGTFLARETAAAGPAPGLTSPQLTPASRSKPVAAPANGAAAGAV